MPSRQSVPRIRVDLLDSSPCSMSPSSTFDIGDILRQVKLFPKLLAEDFVFDDADDALYLENSCLQDVPPLPVGRQPPLFILDSHRLRLPFPIRTEAFELGDFCWGEEDVCPLLTVPTIPRMKLMIKEQLYVQKWVDTVTSDNPPKHIPWTCDKPAMERKWIAEGSIFPAATVESSTEQRGVIQEPLRVTDTNGISALTDQVPHSGEVRAFSEASTPIHAPMSRNFVKSADVDPSILRGKPKTTLTPHRIVRTSQAPSPPTLFPSGPPTGTRSTTSDAPLAARRGKPLSGLKLKECAIEQLEYPDIPTAFRGSPGIWSPRSDAFPASSFTDHQSMLLDLESKSAALRGGVSTYIPEPLRPETEMPCASPSVDEWTFTRSLTTFDDAVSGSIDSHVPREIIADTSIFLPNEFSTPAKRTRFTARLGFVSRLHSTSASQSPVKRASDPPGVPLPPRPALVNSTTSPHVRGILKKVKSVRFEDMITKETGDLPSLVVSPPQVSLEGRLPLPLPVSSQRSCTPVPNTAKPSSGPAPVKEMTALGRNIQVKKSAPKSRLPPKRTKASGKLEPIHPNVSSAPGTSKPTSATTSTERPCRTAHVKENTNSAATPQVQAKQKVYIAEADLRRGIEGTTKSRLSAPLRNIFRFR